MCKNLTEGADGRMASVPPNCKETFLLGKPLWSLFKCLPCEDAWDNRIWLSVALISREWKGYLLGRCQRPKNNSLAKVEISLMAALSWNSCKGLRMMPGKHSMWGDIIRLHWRCCVFLNFFEEILEFQLSYKKNTFYSSSSFVLFCVFVCLFLLFPSKLIYGKLEVLRSKQWNDLRIPLNCTVKNFLQ